MKHSLYICYFGLSEPLVQTQVLPYLREIMKDDVRISLLTFEPNQDADFVEVEREKLGAENITWHALRYHKRPSVPATFYDILNGARLIRKIIAKGQIDILHARVHVPMLMASLARKFSRRKPKILFDIRGFFPEEYTNAGIWKDNGLIYKAVKRIEQWLFKEADAFVVLTSRAGHILFPSETRPVEVIPCCVDLARFESANQETRKKNRDELNLNGRRVIAYVGSFGGWYMTNEMIDFFAAAKEFDPNSFALILTQSDPASVARSLKKNGYTDADFLIRKVSPDQIPQFLSAADAAISFIKPCYSKQASSPTKIAEYLACGLLVITNKGIGDLDELIETEGVGVLIDRFEREEYTQALEAVSSMQSDRFAIKCKDAARARFDLKRVGGTRYKRLYAQILKK